MTDLISSSVAHAASPVPTPAALLRRTIYTPTSSWDYATTAISSDQYYMGAIRIFGGETWSLSCINEPFTTSGVYAGCGYDDLYTSCSGSFAYGADGDVIRCASGAPCVTHSIFEDFEAYNSSSSTNFVGCGYGTATLEIVRNPSASASSEPTPRSTSDQITPSPTISPPSTVETGEVTSSPTISGAATSTGRSALYAGGSIGFVLLFTLLCV
ncbi:hypothetical protein KC356_g8299 [Hortaea werneckii]|nr:hypothetical protein KC356_g8299 [Hortaea werneckii]